MRAAVLSSRPQPSVLAYAAHCQTDVRGRPVAGVVVVCRARLAAAAYRSRTAVQVLRSAAALRLSTWVSLPSFCWRRPHCSAPQTVVHELFHALGFSKHLFHTWRACASSTTGFTPGVVSFVVVVVVKSFKWFLRQWHLLYISYRNRNPPLSCFGTLRFIF